MSHKNRSAIPLIIAIIGICGSSYAYTVDDIMGGIQWRQQQTSRAAVEFEVNIETGRSQEFINGRMIVNENRFLFDFKHDRGKEQPSIVRARSFDGKTAFRVIHDEGRATNAGSADRVHGNHIRQLILNPGVLATGNAIRDNRRALVFDSEEVLSIVPNQKYGEISVITDGTKRSDYDEIIYTLLPEQGWATKRIEYKSGSRIVATLEGRNFSSIASSVPVALEWVYQRQGDLTQLLPGKIRKATVRLSLLPEVDFESNKIFQLDFDNYGVIKNPRKEGEKAALRKIETVLGTNNVKYQHEDILDQGIEFFINQKQGSLQTKSDSSVQLVSDAQVQGGTEQLRSDDYPIVNDDNKSTRLPILTSRWSVVGTILGITTVLFVLCSRALLRVRRHKTSVHIRRSFLVVCVISLAFAAISAIVLTAEPLTPIAARSEEQVLKQEQYSNSLPVSHNWPFDLNKIPYVGRIDVGGGKMLPYQGELTRINEIERHVWYTGAAKNTMVMDHETTNIFIGNLEQPIATYWAPSMYSLLTKIAYMKSIPVNVYDKGWKGQISLDGLKFEGNNLRSAHIKVIYLENNLLRIELKSKDKPIYIVDVTLKGEGLICEEHSYYDFNGAIIFRYEVEYSG